MHVILQAGALGTTVKESQTKIIELQHLVEALRYFSCYLNNDMKNFIKHKIHYEP